VRYGDFEVLVRRLADEVPAEFMAGVAEIAVSPRVVPHPVHAGIFTLGECIPLPTGSGEGPEIQSRIVLYHGSFGAVAEDHPGFDWRAEAWETLTHELRHHLEWRARAPDLEAFDEAAEQNFSRHEGGPFDPGFYRDGASVAEQVYRIDDDYFVERVTRGVPPSVELAWRGVEYRVDVPAEASLPAFLTVEGVTDPPPGELVIVLRGPARVRDLLQRRRPFQAVVTVRTVGA